MKRIARLAPSPAMVVSCIALLVALGGVGYAATALPRNSVGTPQLKRNAVTSIKVKDRSLLARDFRRGQLPRGLRGLQGVKGDKGDKGDLGTPGSAAEVLGSGKTVRGTYAAQSNVNGGQYRTGVSLQQPLPAGLNAPNIHFIKVGDPVPAGCSGSVSSPGAAAGHLCVFEGVQQGNTANRGVVNPINDAAPNQSMPPFGFGVYSSCNTSPCLTEGTWAVTAP